MTRVQANKILDDRRRGAFIAQRTLIAALRATGDIGPDERPRCFRRVSQFGRSV